MTKKLIVLLSIMCLCSNIAFAAGKTNKKKLFIERKEISFSIFDATIDDNAIVKNTVGIGITGTYYVDTNFSIGADLSMNKHEGAIGTVVNRVNINTLGLHSKIYSKPFNICNTEFRAYGVFGIASYGLEVKTNVGIKDDDRAFGLNYGFGLMHDLSNNLVLNLEVREHHGFQADLSGLSSYEKTVYTNYGINIGYRF